MLNFMLIFTCLLVGYFLRKLGRFPSTAPQALNAFIIHLSLPAVVLTQLTPLLQRTTLGPEMLIPISMPWILFSLSVGFFIFIGKKLAFPAALTGALILTAGLGNTSFVGFPLLEALVGKEALGIGVVLDQLGSFLVLSTLGLIVATTFDKTHGNKLTIKKVALRVFTFPPFLALLASFVWATVGVDEQGLVMRMLERIAATLVPIALVTVGMQLKLSPALLKRRWKPLAIGLGFKLVLAPVFFFVLYGEILGATGFITRITLLEAAMAPMITAAVVAGDFNLDAEIANLMVGLGIPLSLLTVPLWNYCLGIVGTTVL